MSKKIIIVLIYNDDKILAHYDKSYDYSITNFWQWNLINIIQSILNNALNAIINCYHFMKEISNPNK